MCFLILQDFGDNNYNDNNNKIGSVTEYAERSSVGSVFGLAKKAGALRIGSELVIESVRKGRALHVYISSDVSENTVKKLCDKTAFYNVPATKLNLTMDELAHCIGCMHPTAAVSLTDKNFLKLMEKCLKDSDDTT